MKSRRRSYLKLGVALLLALAAFALLYFGMKALEGRILGGEEEGLIQDSFGQITFEGKTYKPKTQMSTMLFIGLDRYEAGKENERGDAMSDFLALVAFDKNEETYNIIHINRDTMMDVPVLGAFGDPAGTSYQQIAWAHSYGSGGDDSCRNTADAVSELLLGVTVDNYVSVTMDAVSVLNDHVGGVEVKITEDFSNIDKSLVMGERIRLTGEQAVTYVRSRSGIGDESNLSRMERQKKYMRALVSSLEAAYVEDSTVATSAAEAIEEYIVTDCTLGELSDLAADFSSFTLEGIISPEGKSEVGEKYMEHTIDEDALTKMVIDIFYKEVE